MRVFGVMTAAERELFPSAEDGDETGKARVARTTQGWSRLSPHDPFPTITTQLDPGDAGTGSGLHWHESRPFTVLEGKRAQGFLDEEVLLGSQLDKWRSIGNSVSRHMALALGLKSREAWVGGLGNERKRGSRESTRGVSEGMSVVGMRVSTETVAGEVNADVEDITVEEQVKREEWEEMAGLVITDAIEVATVQTNGNGKRALFENAAMKEGHFNKIQRFEKRAENIVVTETTTTKILSRTSPFERQIESNHALPSPVTSPEKITRKDRSNNCPHLGV